MVKNNQNLVKKKFLLLKYQKKKYFFGQKPPQKMACFSRCFHMESPRNNTSDYELMDRHHVVLYPHPATIFYQFINALLNAESCALPTAESSVLMWATCSPSFPFNNVQCFTMVKGECTTQQLLRNLNHSAISRGLDFTYWV